MDTHKNARLTPKGREEMVRAIVDRGMSNAAAARQFNTTPKTVAELNHRLATLVMLPASAKLIAGKRPKALNALRL
jgi:transposase-like protein